MYLKIQILENRFNWCYITSKDIHENNSIITPQVWKVDKRGTLSIYKGTETLLKELEED